MIKLSNDYWVPMIDDFMVPNPILRKRIVNWYPFDTNQAMLQYESGTIHLYHRIINVHLLEEDHKFKCILIGDQYEDPYTYMDESEWIELFSTKFRRKFISTERSIDDVALSSGISFSSIHSYRTARKIPSLYSANRLINTMKRSLSELYVANYEEPYVANVRTPDEWDDVIEDIMRLYPAIARDVCLWYPIGLYEVHLKLTDGTRYLYDIRTRQIVYIYSEDIGPVLMPEEEWREIFSERLRRFMTEIGMSRSKLARIVEVTPMMMYKYMYGKATPSLYKATRIARALDKTLTDFQVM